jgi:manganese-dependent ADP-ribose/CDP-alcohol diphosphatase
MSLFTFGLFADVQFADIDDDGSRRYRASTGFLTTAVADFNATKPSFVVNLGDIIEGRDAEREWEVVDAALQQLQVPLRNVIGNHCLRLPRERLQRCLNLAKPYFAFEVDATRTFIILDSQDLSLRGTEAETPARAQSDEMLANLRATGAANAVDWNGGFSTEQLQWLSEQLGAAAAARRRAILFAHIPVLRAATSQRHLLWNSDDVLLVLRQHSAVVEALFCGHYHPGGYGVADGVHHVTLDGIVEAPVTAAACHAYVDVYEDRIELRGAAGSSIVARTLAK